MTGVDHIANVAEPVARHSDVPLVDRANPTQREQQADVVAVRVADDHADVLLAPGGDATPSPH